MIFPVAMHRRYDVVYADPPWAYYGSTTKDAAAGKHYTLMPQSELMELPIRSLFRSSSGALFLWATCSRLDYAIDMIRAWGLHYRGVAFQWIKTRRDGKPMGARGVPPTATKPVTEMVLLSTLRSKGRPFPLLSARVSQTVFAPVTQHSRKPPEVRDRIVQLYGDRPRVELFAREAAKGWDRWGNEAPK